MTRFAHIAQRLFNRPLALTPAKADMLVLALAHRLGIASINGQAVRAGEYWGEDEDFGPRETPEEREIRLRGYDNIGPLAIIPIEGTLVQKLGAARPACGMTGYDSIRHALLGALANPEIGAITFDIDSPGGEVSGCFDLVDEIHAARGAKPMVAVLTEMACSAAYAIASATDSICIPRTGYAGSIGVIGQHVDFSRMLDAEGITVSLIRSGARKAEGDPYTPLSDDVRARLQDEIDAAAALFFDTIARNRGLDAGKIAALEGAAFMAQDALAHGLVDHVMSPDQARAELLASIAA